MATQNDRELDFQIRSREGRISLIKEVIIPELDAPKWKDEYETNPASVEKSARSLAEEYHDLAAPLVYGTAVLVLLLFAIDYMVYLHSQVYGLFLNILAGICFIFPSLKGRYVIASIVDGEDKAALRKLEAQEMASNNVGMALLGGGFLVQVLTVQFLSRPELLRVNIAAKFLPGWTTGIMLLTALYIGAKCLNRSRSRKLAQRKN
ncbi:hypothetical protein [Halomicrococcus sp. SG-WS-1]|uniref:hypothetical protein n=1 Tax=Halomicrococcus sp. SG-WS-1 TaxID=3439057 RepID=UPI003F7A7A3C